MKPNNIFLPFVILFATALLLGGLAACTDSSNCKNVRDDAATLKDQHQHCESGDSCVIVDMLQEVGPNTCLGPFQCSASLNTTDIDSFIADAKELAGDYQDCSDCVMADCVSMENYQGFCNETTSRCDIQPKP